MLKRRLGRTNFEASVVGFGGIPIEWQPREEAVKTVKRAIELGVNYIDTARSYSDSEDKIGEAIKGFREQLFIATKSHFRTKRAVAQSIEESLSRLQINKLDLMQIHSVDTEEDLKRCLTHGGVLEAIEEAREAGKLEYIGISGHQNRVLVQAIETGKFDTVLASYNLTNDDADQELFPLAQELDVGIIIMKPLAGGALAVPPEAEQFHIAEKAISTAEVALRFVLSNPKITTAIPGMGTIAEVEQNIPLGYGPQSIAGEEIEKLQEKAEKLGYTFCQGCGYCLPECPEEVNIQEVFRLQAFYDRYGMTDYAKRTYQESHQEKVRRCTECQSCLERCPAQLDIPILLKKADVILGARR